MFHFFRLVFLDFFIIIVTDNYIYRNRTIRYCLSDGRQWMFAIYTRDDLGNRISYEGVVLTLLEPRPEIQQEFEKDVRRLLEVLWHWVYLSLITGINH